MISFFLIFQNFIQHYLKKIFVTNFLFIADYLTPPPPTHPLNSQNPLSMKKLFFSILPYIYTIICRQSLEACNQTKHQERNFIVQESKLLELLYLLLLCQCIQDSKHFGHINFKCKYCGVTGRWKNQDMIGRMPELKLLLSAGLSVSGNKMQSISKELILEFLYCKNEISC